MTDRQTVSTVDYERLKKENEELRQYLNDLEVSHAIEVKHRQHYEDLLVKMAHKIQGSLDSHKLDD